MKIHSWTASASNFGDDLNLWLWKALLPGLSEAGGETTLFVGIGSVLGSELPPAKTTILLGAGAGYGVPPPDFGGPGWRIYGVRGPLSARLCGLGPDSVLADPAILLPRVLPAARPPAPAPVCFVPHIHSALRAPWGEICRRAGIELLDPRGDSKALVRRLAEARLVLAESMHAAIVADAYRVPWIPVWSTREINRFKWLDWSLALGTRIWPEWTPAPSPLAWIDDLAAPFASNDNADLFAPPTGADAVELDSVVAAVRRVLAARNGTWPLARRRNYLRARKRLIEPALRLAAGRWSERVIDRCAGRLATLAAMEGALTDEAAFSAACARLDGALDRFRRDWL